MRVMRRMGGQAWLGASAAIITLTTPVIVAPLSPEAGAFDTGSVETSAPLDATDVAMLVAVTQQATLRVATAGCDGSVRGSAFSTDVGIFTNQHLVAGVQAATVDRSIPPLILPEVLPVIGRDEGNDVALLPPMAVPRLRFSDQPAEPGEAVVLVGHPGGYGLEHLQGTIHGYVDGIAWGYRGEVMLIDAETVLGYSSGPVMNRQGEVVAMLSGFDQATGLTIAIAAAELEEWVAAAATVSPSGKEVRC